MAEIVRVYHGSRGGLQGAIRPVSDCSADFGCGFYMGDEITQPQTLICEAKTPVLYTLDLNLDGLKVLRLEPNVDWSLFVAFNRGKLEAYRDKPFYERFRRMRDDADVIFGKIANDKMFTVLNLFFDGLIGVTALVKAMAAVNIGNQYCAKTAKACAQISVVDEKRFSPHECELLKDRCFRQRARGASEAERICKQNRREGESFDEILERLSAEGGVSA